MATKMDGNTTRLSRGSQSVDDWCEEMSDAYQQNGANILQNFVIHFKNPGPGTTVDWDRSGYWDRTAPLTFVKKVGFAAAGDNERRLNPAEVPQDCELEDAWGR